MQHWKLCCTATAESVVLIYLVSNIYLTHIDILVIFNLMYHDELTLSDRLIKPIKFLLSIPYQENLIYDKNNLEVNIIMLS